MLDSDLSPPAAFFDGQATRFNHRAGLPDGAPREIAGRILALAALDPGDPLLELGSGTGQIGRELSAAAVRYLGLDVSTGMLAVDRQDRHGAPGTLLRADADRRWPIADGRLRLVFGSRALHRLTPDLLAAEVARTGSPRGVTLIVGRVRREPGSVRRRMAEAMRQRLAERGYQSRGGQGRARALRDACLVRGAVALPIVEAARWPVEAAPRTSLDSWRSLRGLGGVEVPETTKAEILNDLADWAERALGGLDRPQTSEETYELEALRWPPTTV